MGAGSQPGFDHVHPQNMYIFGYIMLGVRGQCLSSRYKENLPVQRAPTKYVRTEMAMCEIETV